MDISVNNVCAYESLASPRQSLFNESKLNEFGKCNTKYTLFFIHVISVIYFELL